jgi:HEAT repeat protein
MNQIPSSHHRILQILCVVVLVVATDSTSRADPSYYEKTLLESNIQPTAKALNQYLKSLHPNRQSAARVAHLISEMGSADSFRARENATKQLILMPRLPTEALIKATQSKDPEVRWRAKSILNAGQPESERVLYAALKTIAQKPITGVTSEVLKAIPLCDENHLRFAARAALKQTTSTSDAGILRGSLKSENVEVRIAAIQALAHAQGKKAAADLRARLVDSDDRVRLAVARAIANFGDRKSLAVLLKLLSSDNVQVRASAVATLRQLTSQRFGFAAYERSEKRTAMIAKWKSWIDSSGGTAKLRFPLKNVERPEIGNTIISDYTQSRVVVLSQAGKEIREIRGYSGPWGTVHLANGHLLVNWYGSSCVVEYDADGKEVWKFQKADVQSPWSAERIPNGNTLIAHQTFALEVDVNGKTVWQAQLEAGLSHAIRLENGNTLASLLSATGKVVEVDPRGKVVWEINGLSQPYRIQRLSNGNTLVVDRGRNRVVEFDPSGKDEVWSHESLNGPDSAQRLSNGNTLISDSQFIREVDPAGKTVWEKSCNQCIVWRY